MGDTAFSRKTAQEEGGTGVYLILSEADVQNDASGIWLCLDCAEKRGLDEYEDHFSIVEPDEGRLPTFCADCGKPI